jgi:hypothetical protein
MESQPHRSRKSEDLRAAFLCVLFCIGLMGAIGLAFWYWNQNDFVPDAAPGNPVESKPPIN